MKNTDISIDLDSFPSTRYQGSKRKIIGWLHEKFRELEFHTVLDGFGGTSSVSYLFKKMGKQVTYNDKYRFNSIIGKAIIENDKIKLTEEDIDFLYGKHPNLEYYNLVSNNFSSVYYTDKENRWIDMVMSNILQFDSHCNKGEEITFKTAIAFYSLFQSCLMKRPFNMFHRKNLYLRTNDVERSFGNKTTWEKSFEYLFKKFVDEANALIFDSGERCISMNESIFDIKNTSYDLVYLDPPYISSRSRNETSDYLRCYHFLEGLSNYENWEKLIDYQTKNLRFKNTIESNDFKRSTVKGLLTKLIRKYSDSIIVLSYKKGGIPDIEYLKEEIGKHKSNVLVYSRHYKYALNNQNGDASKNREVLLIGI